MAIHKKGLAHWEGDLKHGKGTVSTESGALSQQPYGFNTRFEGVKGTNPEELIGAAHAACFSMALSLMLSEEGYTATSIDTTAVVTLNKTDGGLRLPISRCKARSSCRTCLRRRSMRSSRKRKQAARYRRC